MTEVKQAGDSKTAGVLCCNVWCLLERLFLRSGTAGGATTRSLIHQCDLVFGPFDLSEAVRCRILILGPFSVFER